MLPTPCVARTGARLISKDCHGLSKVIYRTPCPGLRPPHHLFPASASVNICQHSSSPARHGRADRWSSHSRYRNIVNIRPISRIAAATAGLPSTGTARARSSPRAAGARFVARLCHRGKMVGGRGRIGPFRRACPARFRPVVEGAGQAAREDGSVACGRGPQCPHRGPRYRGPQARPAGPPTAWPGRRRPRASGRVPRRRSPRAPGRCGRRR